MIAAKLAISGIQTEPSRRQPGPLPQEPARGSEAAFARLMDAGPEEGSPRRHEAGEAASDAPAADQLDREHADEPGSSQPMDLPSVLFWQGHNLSRERITSVSEQYDIRKAARATAVQHFERQPPVGGVAAGSAVLVAHLGTAQADRETETALSVVGLRREEGSPERRPETAAGGGNATIRKAVSHDHAGHQPDTAAQRDGKSSGRRESVQETAEPLAAPTTTDRAIPPSPARQIVEALRIPMAELSNNPPAADAPVPAKQLQIVLQPDHLGEVNVTLRLEGQRLRVTIEAERPDTATLLMQDKTALDGILQGVASEAVSVSIAVREADAGGASSGTQHDAGGSPTNHTGTMGQRGEGRSLPDKAPGARLRRLEETMHEEPRAPDPARRGIVVI